MQLFITIKEYDDTHPRLPRCGKDCLKGQLSLILQNGAVCASAYGGLQNAQGLVDKMMIYNVPSPYAGPFQGSYNAVTANNNGATPGWQDAANTQTFINADGKWDGSQYGTFVGNKFNGATLGQQLTMLFHEMAHPLSEVNSGGVDLQAGFVDNPNGRYSPYGGLTGGVPMSCGTAALPPRQ
jgi:hypothetical protein